MILSWNTAVACQQLCLLSCSYGQRITNSQKPWLLVGTNMRTQGRRTAAWQAWHQWRASMKITSKDPVFCGLGLQWKGRIKKIRTYFVNILFSANKMFNPHGIFCTSPTCLKVSWIYSVRQLSSKTCRHICTLVSIDPFLITHCDVYWLKLEVKAATRNQWNLWRMILKQVVQFMNIWIYTKSLTLLDCDSYVA